MLKPCRQKFQNREPNSTKKVQGHTENWNLNSGWTRAPSTSLSVICGTAILTQSWNSTNWRVRQFFQQRHTKKGAESTAVWTLDHGHFDHLQRPRHIGQLSSAALQDWFLRLHHPLRQHLDHGRLGQVAAAVPLKPPLHPPALHEDVGALFNSTGGVLSPKGWVRSSRLHTTAVGDLYSFTNIQHKITPKRLVVVVLAFFDTCARLCRAHSRRHLVEKGVPVYTLLGQTD